MPPVVSSPSITPISTRVAKLSMNQVVGKLQLERVENRPTTFPACQLTNVLGDYHAHACGLAMEVALGVMAQSKLSPADVQAVERTMSWLGPKQSERLGNPVLRRITALAVMHAAVNELLKDEPVNQTLIECEANLRKSIVNIAVASGKCEHPPTGGDEGGPTTLVAERLKEAGKCLMKCASVVDTQAFAGAVVRAVLPEALGEAIGDRLGAKVEALKGQGETSLDVMNVLDATAIEKVRQTVQKLSYSENFESVQNAILMLLEIPEFVVQGQAGAPQSKGADQATPQQLPPMPPEWPKFPNGGQAQYTNSPNTVNNNFSDLAKVLKGNQFDLKEIRNLVDSVRRDAYDLGHAHARIERLLEIGEDQRNLIQKKNDRISELELKLAEKNAEYSVWGNGSNSRVPPPVQKHPIYSFYASTEVGRRSVVDPKSEQRPPVPLVTAHKRDIPIKRSEPIYDIPEFSVQEATYVNVDEQVGKEREFPRNDSVVSSTKKPLAPVLTQPQTGGSERATESEVYSSVASSMSDPSEHDRESVDYVNTRWNRSRNSSGSSMGRGDLPPMSMLEEFEQVIKKKGPGEEYERYSYPHATVLNAKVFKEQLLSQVHSSDSDSDSVGAEQRVGFESGHAPSARLKKLFDSSEQRVSMRAQRAVYAPHASNLLFSLGSAGESGSDSGSSQLSDVGSSQVSDDVPELIKVLNGLKQRPRVYSNSLANGSEQFPKDGRRW